MLFQNTPGYLQEVPDFAEGPESYVGEFPFPMPSSSHLSCSSAQSVQL